MVLAMVISSIFRMRPRAWLTNHAREVEDGTENFHQTRLAHFRARGRWDIELSEDIKVLACVSDDYGPDFSASVIDSDRE